VKRPRSVSPTEDICRERHRATGHLVSATCGRCIHRFIHLFLRNEKHQGAICDCHYTHRNDHLDFIFDLRPRSSLYRDEQGKRATAQGRDGDNAKRGVNAPLLALLRQILNAASSLSVFLCAWSWPFCAAPFYSSISPFGVTDP